MYTCNSLLITNKNTRINTLYPVRGINWVGIMAWIIGGGFALLETLGVVTVFSPALDGVILAFVAYWILYSLLKNTKLAGSGDMTIDEACSVAQ